MRFVVKTVCAFLSQGPAVRPVLRGKAVLRLRA
jgi:hypothetical protein